ncbi:hypothetical protein [Bythopirellula polymerisocia]|uniref:PEP-CTERM protein-sorting domain-containing protein n=1 Tax=Bythopirellula polymerisocia TaxID=2528003 RepID=A0A5C6CJ18_9BACT|nr:hypothetical protein [Bythopirellula polymerisocia]TWU24793.1 hypothetical protein Pla144_36790 [Bythopirellula polymerisocia]
MRNCLGTITIIAWSLSPSLTIACSKHGTNAGGELWLPTNSSGGVVQGFLTLETSLVPPTVPTTCTAGVGLGSLGNLAPNGVTVTGMSIVVFNNSTGASVPLPAFSFLPNSITTTSLMAGSGSSVQSNTNPLFEGSSWFGFSSAVASFLLPVLSPDEMLAFQFAVELPTLQLPLRLEAHYAGGEGQSEGTPIFDGTHPVQYFTVADPSVLVTAPVPEPNTLTLAITIGVILVLRRSSALYKA